MIKDNYERIRKKIAESAGLTEDEIERRVEAKRSKLAGLISKEGAAQVVASELGISFDDGELKIDELLPGMRKVKVVGKVIKMFPIRTFTTKKGDASKVVNFFLADETSNIKVVLWDTNHISLIEKGQVLEGSVVEISSGSMRDNELHLGSFSEFKLSDKVFENVKTESIVKEKNIADFRVSDNVKTRAFIVQAFELKFFEVCPECKKKIIMENDSFKCNEHGKILPEKRALINLVLDDGTDTVRAVFFHEALSGLGLTELENSERVMNQKEDLLGKEMVFSGNVRMNKFFNTPEFIVDRTEVVNLDELIGRLEK